VSVRWLRLLALGDRKRLLNAISAFADTTSADSRAMEAGAAAERLTGDTSFDGYYKLGWNYLAGVAQGLGAEASTAQSVEEVAPALGRGVTDAGNGFPQVVVVDIDVTEAPPHAYPAPPKLP
jgi:hypothetical protein